MPVCLWREGTGSRSSGKERDADTGLDYFGTRYYGGAQGRFLTVDPGPFAIADPQSWNRYSYVQNNPLKFIDPTGKMLVLNGTDAEDLVDELELKTGYKLKRNKKGKIEIDSSVKRQTKGTSKELANELKEVIDDKNTISIDVGHDQANVFFDNYSTQELDMSDYKAVNNQYPSLASSLLGHVLEEYQTAASLGGFT